MQVDYQSILAQTSDAIYFTDIDRVITYWNAAAERLTGYKAADAVGRRCSENILVHVDESGRSLCLSRCPLERTLQDFRLREMKAYLLHKQGHRIPVHIRVMPLIDTDGRVMGAAEFFTDISMHQGMQMRLKELEALALMDPLTQLPNRRHLEPELISRFQEMERLGLRFGLLFLDIDHFKRFNDTYGHDAGDQALRVVAETLKKSVRPFDLVGRWGGEEFLCIARNVDQRRLLQIGQRIRRLVGKSAILLENNVLSLTASIGATMAEPSDTVEGLIKRADHLMYASKNQGRNRVTCG